MHFSKVLNKAFGKQNYISRVGGDEFMIVLKNDTMESIPQYKEKIKAELQQYEDLDFLSEIDFSFGFKFFPSNNQITTDIVFDEVDILMYQDKSKNKNLQRRSTDKK